jgi:thioesterase domain-containing protein
MVQMIRAVQPIGPYHVAGLSFGGTLAYEIAVQLLGADEQLNFVALIDSRCGSGMDSLSGFCQEASEESRQSLLIAASLLGEEVYVDEKTQGTINNLTKPQAAINFGNLPPEYQEVSRTPETRTGPATKRVSQDFGREHPYLRAEVEYHAHAIPIPVHLFVAQESHVSEPCLGWNSVLPESLLRVISVAGTRSSMCLPPNVDAFGQAVSYAIHNASSGLRGLPENTHCPMVLLQSTQAITPPLFCVPGAGAGVASFINLVGCLGIAWPIYGLQPRGLDGASIPHSTVSAASDCYLRAVCNTYPKGPIHLLGHSFGGWVVFEMAQRLSEMGRSLASLTILDSEVPGDNGKLNLEYDNTDAIMEWVATVEQLLERPLKISRRDIESRNESAQRKLLHNCLIKEGLLPRRSQPDALNGPLKTFAASIRTQYSPKAPYQRQMQLVLVDDATLGQDANRQRQKDIVEGWKLWAPNLVVRHASGNHLTVLNLPHVFSLARVIQFHRHERSSG